MGRKAVPIKILQQRGSKKIYDRKGPEPQPPDEPLPECPAWLAGNARKKWFELSPRLHKMGILTSVDTEPFARYCHALSRWYKMREFIDKAGEVYPIREPSVEVKNESGEVIKVKEGKIKCFQQFPQVGIYNRLTLLLRGMEADFGLNPSARAGMAIRRDNDSNSRDKGRFFNPKNFGQGA